MRVFFFKLWIYLWISLDFRLTLWFPLTHFFHPHLLPPAATNMLSVSMSLVFDFWFVALSLYSTYKIDRVVFVFLYLTYFA